MDGAVMDLSVEGAETSRGGQAMVDFSLSNRDRSYLSICSCIPVRFDYELFHSEETTGKCS